jgi:hypothetical protein
MAKSIQTNFSFRLADTGKPVLIGDKRVASALSGDNFYSVTYTVDKVGTYLGEIKEFLAVQCADNPILIEFQRVDMKVPNQIYCESLFINHGDFGRVWLRIPPQSKPVIATVWYSSDTKILPLDEHIKVNQFGKRAALELKLKNLTGQELGLPIETGINTFSSLPKIDGNISAITHSGKIKSLPVHKTNVK